MCKWMAQETQRRLLYFEIRGFYLLSPHFLRLTMANVLDVSIQTRQRLCDTRYINIKIKYHRHTLLHIIVINVIPFLFYQISETEDNSINNF